MRLSRPQLMHAKANGSEEREKKISILPVPYELGEASLRFARAHTLMIGIGKAKMKELKAWKAEILAEIKEGGKSIC